MIEVQTTLPYLLVFGLGTFTAAVIARLLAESKALSPDGKVNPSYGFVSSLRKLYVNQKRLQLAFVLLTLVILIPTLLIGLIFKASFSDILLYITSEIAILSLLFTVSSVYRPKSRVIFASKPSSYFSSEIGLGLQETFAARSDFELIREDININASTDFYTAFRKVVYKHLFSPRLAAVIVRAPYVDESIKNLLVSLKRLNIIVIVLDYDIGEEDYSVIDDKRPAYILSDFREGGRLVASVVDSFVATDNTEEIAVLCMGPSSSTTGSARSKSLLWDLLMNGHHEMVIPQIISTWDRNAVCDQLHDHISNSEAQKVVVFAGNDNIALGLSMLLLKKPIKSKDVGIVGYDGIKEGDGSWLLQSKPYCIATIDVKPRDQGRSAAELVLATLLGGDQSDLRVQRLEPSLIELNGFSVSPVVRGTAGAGKGSDSGGEDGSASVIHPVTESGKTVGTVKDVSGPKRVN